MTVGLALICENGISESSQKIIMCADRQISTGINNFESGVPKIMSINGYCYVMISSDNTAKTHRVLDKVANSIAGQKLSIEEIAKAISKEFENAFSEEREKRVLSRFGLTYNDFIKKSAEMSPVLLNEISNLLEGFKTEGSHVIVTGLDPAPHLYVISEEGNISFEDKSGFAVIGSGSYLAYPEMTRHEPAYNPQSITLYDALIRIYRAKKVAQRVGGVGPTTDLAVLHLVNGIVNIWEVTANSTPESLKSLAILDNVLSEINNQEKEILNKANEELVGIFNKEVEKVEEKSKEENKT